MIEPTHLPHGMERGRQRTSRTSLPEMRAVDRALRNSHDTTTASGASGASHTTCFRRTLDSPARKNAVYSLLRATAKGRAVCANDLRTEMDNYRHLAVDETELARWVLYNLMVYVLALWGTHSNDAISGDIDDLHKTLAAIRTDITTT